MKKGFSLVELLVALAITALFAVTTAPTFTQIQSLSNFRGEVDTIFGVTASARSNALTQKQCEGKEAKIWMFEVDNTTSPSTATLLCENVDGVQSVSPVAFSPHTVLSSVAVPKPILVDTHESDKVRILFVVDGLQTKIARWDKSINPSGEWNVAGNEKTQVVFEHALSNSDPERWALCFDRVAGFPTLHQNIGSTNPCIP